MDYGPIPARLYRRIVAAARGGNGHKKSATSQELVQLRARYGSPDYHPLPVVVGHALDCQIWDVEGRAYLDMMGAYSAVSHGHLPPRLVGCGAAYWVTLRLIQSSQGPAIL